MKPTSTKKATRDTKVLDLKEYFVLEKLRNSKDKSFLIRSKISEPCAHSVLHANSYPAAEDFPNQINQGIEKQDLVWEKSAVSKGDI